MNKIFLLVAFFAISLTVGNVIGIDFGSNFISVGLLKSGHAITIVRNDAEKRITPSYVTLDGKDRYFGARSVSKASRQSMETTSNIIQLLGRSAFPEHLTYPYPHPFFFEDDDRGTLLLNSTKLEEPAPVELLAAVILQAVQKMTNVSQKIEIKDCVITVPAYYTQTQRLAILDAAQIAQLHVLGLIESNVASAFQYGMERSRTMSNAASEDENGTKAEDESSKKSKDKNVMRNVIFADIGGSQGSLSLVKYDFPQIDVKKKAKKGKKAGDEESDSAVANTGIDEDDFFELFDLEAANALNAEPGKAAGGASKEEYDVEVHEKDDDADDDEAEPDDDKDDGPESVTLTNQDQINEYMKKQQEKSERKKKKEEAKKKRAEAKKKAKETKIHPKKDAKKGKDDDDAAANPLLNKKMVNGIDINKYVGRMEVLLTAHDERLGGRSIDGIIVNRLIQKYHSAVAPDEVKSHGNCRPYLEAQPPATPAPDAHHTFPAPLFPTIPPDYAAKHPNASSPFSSIPPFTYPGAKCLKLLSSPSILLHFYKTATQLKEILSVAPSFHGQLDDILPELPEYRFDFSREELETELASFVGYFREMVRKFKDDMIEQGLLPVIENTEGESVTYPFVIQILGGSLRIPILQQTLLSVFNNETVTTAGKAQPQTKTEITKLLNQDESSALGSTMYAATLNTHYFVKGIKLVQRLTRDIVLEVDNNDKNQTTGNATVGLFKDSKIASNVFFVDGGKKVINIFPKGTTLPAKRALIFEQDFFNNVSVKRRVEHEEDKDNKDKKKKRKRRSDDEEEELEIITVKGALLTFRYSGKNHTERDGDLLPKGVSPVLARVSVSEPSTLPSLLATFGTSENDDENAAAAGGGIKSMYSHVFVEVGNDGVVRVVKGEIDITTEEAVVESERERKRRAREAKLEEDDKKRDVADDDSEKDDEDADGDDKKKKKDKKKDKKKGKDDEDADDADEEKKDKKKDKKKGKGDEDGDEDKDKKDKKKDKKKSKDEDEDEDEKDKKKDKKKKKSDDDDDDKDLKDEVERDRADVKSRAKLGKKKGKKGEDDAADAAGGDEEDKVEVKKKLVRRHINLIVRPLYKKDYHKYGYKSLSLDNQQKENVSLYSPMSKAEIKYYRKKLAEYDEHEHERERIAELRNQLESYVFEMNEFFPTNREDLIKKEIALDEQIDHALEVLANVTLFLDSDSDVNRDYATYNKYKKNAEEVCDLIVLRYRETKDFPAASDKLKKYIKEMQGRADDTLAAGNMNETEANDLEDQLDEALEWLLKKSKEMKSQPAGATPLITSKEVKERLEELEKGTEKRFKDAERRVKLDKYFKKQQERDEKKAKSQSRLNKKKEAEKKKRQDEEDLETEKVPDDDEEDEKPKKKKDKKEKKEKEKKEKKKDEDEDEKDTDEKDADEKDTKGKEKGSKEKDTKEKRKKGKKGDDDPFDL